MAELTTLARPYARAAFEAALYADRLKSWSSMLGVVAGVVREDKVRKYLGSPSATAEQQATTLIDLCGDDIDTPVRNFIRVLAENKRLLLLPEIVALFEIMKANQEKSIEVEVTSAFPLSGVVEEKLAGALKARLQRDIRIHSKTDKGLIGGMVVRAGDLVIDGSVKGKLGKLAETLKV
jgi:F-type H+-transporting ATPase subunit delta